MDFAKLFFSPVGRLNRKGYWVISIALIIIVLILSAVLGVVFAFTGMANTVLGVKLLSLITTLIMLPPIYFISLKRLHDRERPEILALVFLAPVTIDVILSMTSLTGTFVAQTVFGTQTIGFQPNKFGLVIDAITLGVGLWSLIELGFMRGQSGPNAHGPDPSEMG